MEKLFFYFFFNVQILLTKALFQFSVLRLKRSAKKVKESACCVVRHPTPHPPPLHAALFLGLLLFSSINCGLWSFKFVVYLARRSK
jgi:hypothetical protein